MRYPSVSDVEAICVIGAGTMGHGIAEVAALAGYDVRLQDVDADALERGVDAIDASLETLVQRGERTAAVADAARNRIETSTDLATAVDGAAVVIEAVPERLDLKQAVFADLDELTDPPTVLATNTSSLRVSDIAARVDATERVIGLHWFNPPVKMRLVEVVATEAADDGAVEFGRALVESFDKTPIVCRKDVRQFIVNNVFAGFLFEAMYVVSRGDATIREVDAAMVADGWPMGPFEFADVGGLDVIAHILELRGGVPSVLAERVEAGDLGHKTGRGFYDYDDGPGADYDDTPPDAFDAFTLTATTINQAAWLVHDDVTTAEEVDTGARLGLNTPWGPLAHAREVGYDRVVERLEELYEAHGDERYEPCPLLVEGSEALAYD